MIENDQIMGKWISKIYRQIFHLREAEIKEVPIKPNDYIYFLLIQENPGCTQNFLASELFIDKAAVARAIKLYEKEQLIERRTHQQNKSAHALFLTEAGEQVAIEIRKIINQIQNDIQEKYGKAEMSELIAMLQKLSAHLSDDGKK